MLDYGTRVKIVRGMDAGGIGKVERAYDYVKGILLSQLIYVIRLDEPNEIGSVLVTAVADELEVIGEEERAGA